MKRTVASNEVKPQLQAQQVGPGLRYPKVVDNVEVADLVLVIRGYNANLPSLGVRPVRSTRQGRWSLAEPGAQTRLGDSLSLTVE